MRQVRQIRAMRRGLVGAFVALAALLMVGMPALAQGAVQDAGNLFSAQARQSVANTIAQIEKQTGKQIAVRTVTNLGGKDISATADQAFRDLNLNGVLIFAAKDEKQLAVKVGTNTRQQISVAEEGAIRDQLTAAFAKGDFDGGLTNAVNRIGNDLRAGSGRASAGTAGQPAPAASPQSSGFPWGILLLLLIGGIILAVFLARRAARNARTPYGGYGHGGDGYGPQYGGYGHGGGGFGQGVAGGLLGGIGGAIVGNAIFDRLRGNGGADPGGATQAGGWSGGNDYGQPADSPADVGSWGDTGASVGDWGSGDAGGGDAGGGDSSL